MRHASSILVIVFILSLATPAYNCTTTITGKNALADGAVMVSHTDDGMAYQENTPKPDKGKSGGRKGHKGHRQQLMPPHQD